jgi:hypothetical protein
MVNTGINNIEGIRDGLVGFFTDNINNIGIWGVIINPFTQFCRCKDGRKPGIRINLFKSLTEKRDKIFI